LVLTCLPVDGCWAFMKPGRRRIICSGSETAVVLFSSGGRQTGRICEVEP